MIPGFPFNETDLATNRLGRLTEVQREKVRAELQRRGRILAAILLIGPPVAIAASLIGTRVLGDPIEVSTSIIVAYTITVLLVAPLLGLALYGNYVRPVRTNSVHEFTGKIKLKPKGPDIHLSFGSTLTGPRFSIGPEQASALAAGDRYTIYFTPGGSRALFHSMERAFEPVSNDDDDGAASDDSIVADGND